MRWSESPFNPSRAMLRQFAGLWLAFFLALAGWEGLVRGRTGIAAVLLVLALTVGPLGLWDPRFVRPIFVTWMALAFPIGWVMSWVLLGVVYFGVITPIAFALRRLGHDPLALERASGMTSYWSEKPAVTDVRRYFRRY
jgi:hypothetical protein